MTRRLNSAWRLGVVLTVGSLLAIGGGSVQAGEQAPTGLTVAKEPLPDGSTTEFPFEARRS